MIIRKMCLIAFFSAIAAGAAAQWEMEAVRQELSQISVPADIEDYHPAFHFSPVNQDTTLVCWSFSTLSFIETEMHRLGSRPVRLALMFPVYYTFVEKTRAFVQSKGRTRFEPGDLFSTVFEIINSYGIVPQSVYRGQVRAGKTYNQDSLYAEIKSYVFSLRETQDWDEAKTVNQVKNILDKHLGKPPDSFEFEGKIYSPLSFLNEHVNLPWQDYILVTSFMYAPFDSFCSLNVPDNWRQNSKFFNVPLAQFYAGLIGALQNGYSVAIDGDTGEYGRYGRRDVAFIPAYDIPAEDITQESREYRFEKGLTTDDHLMHMVGYTRSAGFDWFLIKDSWRDAWEGEQKGYFFYRVDFVKLKVLAYLVHRDAVPEIISRIPPGISPTFIQAFH